MFEPRTVKTLTALLAAMTVGILVLMLIDSEPIKAPGMHLAAVAAAQEMELPTVTQTEVPLRKWNSIVIHSSAEGRQAVDNCHIVVDVSDESGGLSPLSMRANKAWLAQAASPHVTGKGNEWATGSIGICLMGDFSKQPPAEQQYESLVKLVTDLQKRFNIPRSRVHLYRNIANRSNSPGDAFPEKDFNDCLR